MLWIHCWMTDCMAVFFSFLDPLRLSQACWPLNVAGLHIYLLIDLLLTYLFVISLFIYPFIQLCEYLSVEQTRFELWFHGPKWRSLSIDVSDIRWTIQIHQLRTADFIAHLFFPTVHRSEDFVHRQYGKWIPRRLKWPNIKQMPGKSFNKNLELWIFTEGLYVHTLSSIFFTKILNLYMLFSWLSPA